MKRFTLASLFFFLSFLIGCGTSTTPASIKAVRNYNGTASVGDFLTISIDSNAHTVNYFNYSNGDSGTVPYTVNVDGTYTMTDPQGNLLDADIRLIVATLKINNDLERMGDLAQNIAKRAAYIAKADPMELAIDFRGMASKAQNMVKQSLDALVNSDTALAKTVRTEDDEVDAARQRIRNQITEAIRRHPDRVEYLLKFNSVSKHLERIADMATNVAEDVIYMVEGEIVRHQHLEE
jgi:phosphate transport system regulatory protein PhoU